MTQPSVDSIREWGAGMWEPFARMASVPRTPAGDDRVLERLDAEAEILDVFRRYHCFYDAGDVDGVMSLFDDECVVVNARGTYAGAAAIRENYEYLCARRRFIIHYGTNPFVRFDGDGFDQARLGAFWYAVVFPHEGPADAAGGTYLNRVRNRGEGWKIFEQRITSNFRARLAEAATAFGAPPAPSDELTSLQLIDPAHVL